MRHARKYAILRPKWKKGTRWPILVWEDSRLLPLQKLRRVSFLAETSGHGNAGVSYRIEPAQTWCDKNSTHNRHGADQADVNLSISHRFIRLHDVRHPARRDHRFGKAVTGTHDSDDIENFAVAPPARQERASTVCGALTAERGSINFIALVLHTLRDNRLGAPSRWFRNISVWCTSAATPDYHDA